MSETPRIFVRCLAAYNNGCLHGEWIDCDQDAKDIYAEIEEILKTSPISDAEEWAIHDYENWHGITINEYENIEKLAELGQAIKEHGAAIALYYDNFQTLENFEDYYQGEYESESDFVENYLTVSGVKKMIKTLNNIKYAALAILKKVAVKILKFRLLGKGLTPWVYYEDKQGKKYATFLKLIVENIKVTKLFTINYLLLIINS